MIAVKSMPLSEARKKAAKRNVMEQAITDLEIANIEKDIVITDLEIAVFELRALMEGGVADEPDVL